MAQARKPAAAKTTARKAAAPARKPAAPARKAAPVKAAPARKPAAKKVVAAPAPSQYVTLDIISILHATKLVAKDTFYIADGVHIPHSQVIAVKGTTLYVRATIDLGELVEVTSKNGKSLFKLSTGEYVVDFANAVNVTTPSKLGDAPEAEEVEQEEEPEEEYEEEEAEYDDEEEYEEEAEEEYEDEGEESEYEDDGEYEDEGEEESEEEEGEYEDEEEGEYEEEGDDDDDWQF